MLKKKKQNKLKKVLKGKYIIANNLFGSADLSRFLDVLRDALLIDSITDALLDSLRMISFPTLVQINIMIFRT